MERPLAAAPTFLGISPALIQGGVNEIVVTAGKREQSIADVARGLAGELELAEDADARLPVSRELGTPRAAPGRGLVSHKRASLYDPDPAEYKTYDAFLTGRIRCPDSATSRCGVIAGERLASGDGHGRRAWRRR